MNQELITAVEAIKTAILQSQYQAAKETTRVQLILYYGIGRYLSSKKGKKTWGTSVLETISSQLRKELPGLRGFSTTSLKKMRLFYENWSFLEDSNSSVMTAELPDARTKGLSKKKWAALIILNLQENSNLLKFKYEQRRKR